MLVCVDWAVPRLFGIESIQKIRVWENYPCAIYLPDRRVNLDIFTLSGRRHLTSSNAEPTKILNPRDFLVDTFSRD